MKFHEMTDSSLNYISAYEENWVKIKNKKYDHSIFILSDSILNISNFSDTQIIELIQDSYSKKKLELVIIASPNNEELNKLNKYKDIIQMQIGFEFMKTDAAYRTFNIILSESREVGLSSNGRRGAGGGLVLTGEEISLLDTSQLISTGATGGGFVLVGGDWQGGANEQRRVFDAADAVYEATKVTIAQGVLIDASATDHGDGGTVVLWSDITNANSVTAAHGSIYAKGGAQSGNGGQIETSGAHLDTNGISVNAGTLSGNSGLWLIDPYDYIINSTAASNIVTALNNNTSVTVTTSNNNTDYGSNGNSGSSGNITVSSSITAATGSGGLTLRAANDIVLSGTIDIGGDIQIIANREITSSDHITIATRGGKDVMDFIVKCDNNTDGLQSASDYRECYILVYGEDPYYDSSDDTA